MTTGKNTDAALAKQLIAGVTKRFSTASTLAFGNGSFTPAQVATSLQTIVDLRSAVDAAKAVAKAKIQAEAAQTPSLRSHMAALMTFVKATFGNSPDVLADFGLTPRKARTPLTIDQMATAAAKRAATRAARHTMGTRQKEAVKGTITTIVSPQPTPANTPVAPRTVASAPATGAPVAGTAPHAS